MKGFVAALLFAALLGGAGYFGAPLLVDRQVAPLRQDLAALDGRLLKLEEFVRQEEAARTESSLPAGADVSRITSAVNGLFGRIAQLEASVQQQKTAADEQVRKSAEAVQKDSADMKQQLKRLSFQTSIATIRGHLLKVRSDLLYKNVGTARTELDLVADALARAKDAVADPEKPAVQELQNLLKKLREDIDGDMAAAITKLDLLWHELGKLMKKA